MQLHLDKKFNNVHIFRSKKKQQKHKRKENLCEAMLKYIFLIQ
jgi:hypothetical protein